MSLTVRISIKDDKGKEAEIELKETDKLSKLVIVQNVFNLFGIEKDIFEQVKEFERIGKAYSSFFEKMSREDEREQLQKEDTELTVSTEHIREEMIDGYQRSSTELKETYETNEEVPEWIKTGIKIDEDERKRYRCRYHCVICNNKGTHYIYEGSSEIRCHSCKMDMPVKPAHPEGFPNQDTHGNFYRAGEYRDWKLF